MLRVFFFFYWVFIFCVNFLKFILRECVCNMHLHKRERGKERKSQGGFTLSDMGQGEDGGLELCHHDLGQNQESGA